MKQWNYLEALRKKLTDGDSVLYTEITEVVLFYFNLHNSSYQQSSRVFYTFNKLFEQLLNTSPQKFIFSRTFNS